jgi:hypothetical protein
VIILPAVKLKYKGNEASKGMICIPSFVRIHMLGVKMWIQTQMGKAEHIFRYNGYYSNKNQLHSELYNLREILKVYKLTVHFNQ